MRVRSIHRWAPPLVIAVAASLVTVMAPAEGTQPPTVEHRGHLYTASGEGPLDAPASSPLAGVMASPDLSAPSAPSAPSASAKAPPSGDVDSEELAINPLSACFWTVSPPCTLGGEKQSMCVMTATCPGGMHVISGGCEGFASVAIGRSAPSPLLNAWTCAASRIFSINNPNVLFADALCCPW